jgi:hypothetical protein
MKLSRFVCIVYIFSCLASCTLSQMSPRTLSMQELSALRQNESIVWGNMDDSFVFILTPESSPHNDEQVEALARKRGSSIWTCVHTGSVLLGKFDSDLSGKQIIITFVNKQTGEETSTSLTAGVSSGFPFYAILPSGTYKMNLHFTWPGFDYRASSDKEIEVEGGRSAIYVGRLHMGQNKSTSENFLFDTDDYERDRSWFQEKHPSFQGSMREQPITRQIVVTDTQGHLFWCNK